MHAHPLGRVAYLNRGKCGRDCLAGDGHEGALLTRNNYHFRAAALQSGSVIKYPISLILYFFNTLILPRYHYLHRHYPLLHQPSCASKRAASPSAPIGGCCSRMSSKPSRHGACAVYMCVGVCKMYIDTNRKNEREKNSRITYCTQQLQNSSAAPQTKR
jgi:hypothetical protein